jgi:hypothetical protein
VYGLVANASIEEACGKLQACSVQLQTVSGLYEFIDKPLDLDVGAHVRSKMLKIGIDTADYLFELRGVGAVAEQVNDVDCTPMRASLAACIEEYGKKTWLIGIDDETKFINGAGAHVLAMDQITPELERLMNEARELVAAFDAEYMGVPITDLGNCCTQLEVVQLGMLTNGDSWRPPHVLPFDESTTWENVCKQAEATLHKQRGLVGKLRAARGSVVEAVSKCTKCREQLGSPPASEDERHMVNRSEKALHASDATIVEATIIHNIYRDLRGSLGNRQNSVEAEVVRCRDTPTLSELVHPAILAKAQLFICT